MSAGREPHAGRSYTAASGALVRVDYVRPRRVQWQIQCVIWPAWWTSKAEGKTVLYTIGEFNDLMEKHDLQPVRATP